LHLQILPSSLVWVNRWMPATTSLVFSNGVVTSPVSLSCQGECSDPLGAFLSRFSLYLDRKALIKAFAFNRLALVAAFVA
jgi:hypothetical protein